MTTVRNTLTRRVVIGSLDGHSVGTRILAVALKMSGYDVTYIGHGCTAEDFIAADIAALAPAAILIASHNELTAQQVKSLEHCRATWDCTDTLWFFRGPVPLHFEKRLRTIFHRLSVHTTEVATVLEMLDNDLGRHPSVRQQQGSLNVPHRKYSDTNVSNTRLPDASFIQQREVVLSNHSAAQQWEYPHNKALNIMGTKSQRPGRLIRHSPLLQPEQSESTILSQRHAIQQLSRYGADMATFNVEPYLRNPQTVPLQPNDAGASPATQLPLQLRYLGDTPERAAEIALTHGVVSIEGGGISHNVSRWSDLPLNRSIRSWQYVDRLVGEHYRRNGVVIDREVCGSLTGTLVPPSIALTVSIIEALLAAEQGVKSITIAYGEQGNAVQDIAAMHVARSLATSYLRHAGFTDVAVHVAFHQYPAAFPLNVHAAAELITASAQTAVQAGADKIILKTPVEGSGTATLRDTIRGIQLAQEGIRSAQPVAMSATLRKEEIQITREVRSLLKTVKSLDKDLAKATVIAFNGGILDIPFSPSQYCQGELTTARDCDGAVRILTFGNLPFSTENKAVHWKLLVERANREKISVQQMHRLTEHDVNAVKWLVPGKQPIWPLTNRPKGQSEIAA